MAGGEGSSGNELRGLSRIFNSQTMEGRANVGKATYAVIGLVLLYKMIKTKTRT